MIFAVLGHSCPFLNSCIWKSMVNGMLFSKLQWIGCHARNAVRCKVQRPSFMKKKKAIPVFSCGQVCRFPEVFFLLLLLRFAVKLAHVDLVVCSTEGVCTKIYQTVNDSVNYIVRLDLLLASEMACWDHGMCIIGSAEALPILCVRCVRWERERERERQTDRQTDGHDVTIVALKLAMTLHVPFPKIRTFRFSLHTSRLPFLSCPATLLLGREPP